MNISFSFKGVMGAPKTYTLSQFALTGNSILVCISLFFNGALLHCESPSSLYAPNPTHLQTGLCHVKHSRLPRSDAGSRSHAIAPMAWHGCMGVQPQLRVFWRFPEVESCFWLMRCRDLGFSCERITQTNG